MRKGLHIVRILPLLFAAVSLLFADAAGAQEAAASAAPSAAPAASAAPAGDAAPAGGGAAVDEAAKTLFLAKCSSCHTIGEGTRVGPDLKGVLERRDEAWVKRFIKAPSTMLDSDPVAKELLAEFNQVRMSDLGLSDEEVASVVELLRICSEQVCVLQGALKPANEAGADAIELGLALFTGEVPLTNGGPACISCHALQGASRIVGGGLLSVDLTNVFARIGGDKALDAALKSPAFKVMDKVFADKPIIAAEVFALRAMLYEANRGGFVDSGGDAPSVPLIALLGSLVVLLGLNMGWSRRRRVGVREALVARKEQRS